MSDFEDDDIKKYQGEDDAIKPIDLVPPPGAAPLSKPIMPGDPGIVLHETAQPEKKTEEHDPRLIKKGDYIDLYARDRTLRHLLIGAGWDAKGFENQTVDVDLCVFLLDRTDKTRDDGDFIFYNNPSAIEGAVKHMGDNRTGAGDGDDENMTVDLNGIPFDILKVVFLLSIYDDKNEGLNYSMVRDVFIRVVNADDTHEVVRFEIDNDDLKGGNVLHVMSLVREGPKWFLEAVGKTDVTGLAGVATKYGIIVKEMQSTANP